MAELITTPGWNGPLLWCDIETTDLDEKTALLLEAGLILTDGRGYEEQASVSGVVGYPDVRSRTRKQIVRDMHERSGLFDAVERSRSTLLEVEEKLIAWCDDLGLPRLCMAGSGVGDFERRWLKEHMPTLYERAFNHRYMEMLTLRRFFGIARPVGEHRVLADLRRDIRMVRSLSPAAAASPTSVISVA